MVVVEISLLETCRTRQKGVIKKTALKIKKLNSRQTKNSTCRQPNSY